MKRTKMITLQCNHFATLTFLFCLVFQTLGQNEIPGQPLRLARQSNINNLCTVGIPGPVCVGCNTLLTCDGVNIDPINTQTCSSQNPNYPYCGDGTCSGTSSPAGLDCTDTDFTCTGPGQFPDVRDCRRYFICDSDSNPTPFGCPPNYVYNSKTGLCRRWICQNVDCSKSLNKYIVYAQDPSILIYCYNDGTTTKALTFRCDDPVNQQYDSSTLKCSFKCVREGRYVDASDCRSFYECFWSGLSFQANHLTCPPGFAYNATTQQCTQQTSCQNQANGQEVNTLLS